MALKINMAQFTINFPMALMGVALVVTLLPY